MDSGPIVALVLVVVVLIGTVAFVMHTRRHHPEQTAGHRGVDPVMQPSAPPIGLQRDPGTDRPGDPGTEGMTVPQPGDIGPGVPPPPTQPR